MNINRVSLIGLPNGCNPLHHSVEVYNRRLFVRFEAPSMTEESVNSLISNELNQIKISTDSYDTTYKKISMDKPVSVLSNIDGKIHYLLTLKIG